MHFTLTTLVLFLSLSSICSTQESCPAIPETGVTIGDPVPIKPEDIPIREDTPLCPSSPYSVSKVTQDMMGLQYYISHQLPKTSLGAAHLTRS